MRRFPVDDCCGMAAGETLSVWFTSAFAAVTIEVRGSDDLEV